MTYIPEDPEHKNAIELLLEEQLHEQRIHNYLLGLLLDIDTTEEEVIPDEDI